MSDFIIRGFQPDDAAEVGALIVGVQRDEFGIAISLADQPDLADIPGFYQTGAGGFWVAIGEGEVLGTIALKDIDEGQGALRKMFVAPRGRGHAGVGQALLKALLAHAQSRGLKEIYLGTTEHFRAAHRFYEKNGFVEFAASSLPPRFPRMPVDSKFYFLDFNKTADL